jgi:hypothetical protein
MFRVTDTTLPIVRLLPLLVCALALTWLATAAKSHTRQLGGDCEFGDPGCFACCSGNYADDHSACGTAHTTCYNNCALAESDCETACGSDSACITQCQVDNDNCDGSCDDDQTSCYDDASYNLECCEYHCETDEYCP